MEPQGRSPGSEQNGIAKLIEGILERRPAPDDSKDRGGREPGLKRILVVSSDYDYFILDEEGRLKNLLVEKCQREERASVPSFGHSTMERAVEAFSSGGYDAVFFFNPASLSEVRATAGAIKSVKDVPTVLVSRGPSESFALADGETTSIDWAFTWSGDGKIFVDIIQFLEDCDVAASDASSPSPWILMADDKPQHYSRLVYETYQSISGYMGLVLPADLTHSQRVERSYRRPRLLLATSPEDAARLYDKHRERLLCLVMDSGMRVPDGRTDAEEFLSRVQKGSPVLPMLLFSSGAAQRGNAVCLDRSAPNVLPTLGEFIGNAIGPTRMVFRNADGAEVSAASDIREFESLLWSVPPDVLERQARNGDIARWLAVMMESELSAMISGIIRETDDTEELRKRMIAAMTEQRKASHRGTITQYSRSDGQHARFSRIGKGAMGGKARGLAFVDKLINTYLGDDVIPGVSIKIPRTIVLCSDIFDRFIEENGIDVEGLCSLSDDRIAQKFMEGALPAPVLGDIRSFIRGTNAPIVVRSSSLLEDALHHPFAGVYASLLLPNESWETDIRFQELCASIKYVFASVYFQKARNYMASLQDITEEEKMAVVIQELVGMKHGSVFYPTISGVAKSYDYYPSGKCRSTDGVVNIALGLGKEVVDGGTAYRFCPVHPRTPKHGTQANLLDNSQKEFFAVDLNSYVNIVQRNEDSTIGRYPLGTAEAHGSLEHTASTYVHGENRIYPGIGRDGVRVLDFAPLLQLETLPVAKLLHILLRMNEMAVGSPVEIEFAMNIPLEGNGPIAFYVLQVRSMRSTGQDVEVELGAHDPEEIFCHATHAMGNGVISGIRDIVYVKRENYDIADNRKIIPQIRKLNEKLMKERIPYILVGPGRWGSTDEWLGIPVSWSDIAGAKLIVETPIEERPVDPSQGSHFFHNMVAARTGYLTVIPGTKSIINWDWLDSFDAMEETPHLRHLRLPVPVEVRIDGGRSEGIILKSSDNARNDANG